MDTYLIRYFDKNGIDQTIKLDLFPQPYNKAVNYIESYIKFKVFSIIKC